MSKGIQTNIQDKLFPLTPFQLISTFQVSNFVLYAQKSKMLCHYLNFVYIYKFIRLGKTRIHFPDLVLKSHLINSFGSIRSAVHGVKIPLTNVTQLSGVNCICEFIRLGKTRIHFGPCPEIPSHRHSFQ